MVIDEALWNRIRDNDPETTPELLFQRADITGQVLNAIAMRFHNGDGVTKSRVKALQWYEKSLSKGYATASRNMGLLYEFGPSIPSHIFTGLVEIFSPYDRGVPKNIVTAARCFQFAIDKGYLKAQQDLDRLFANESISTHDLEQIGLLYIKGDGVVRDHKKGLLWETKAKDKGSAAAIRNIGVLYEFSEGVEKNLVTAVKHYQLALNKGYKSAEQDINRLLNTTDITANALHEIAYMFHSEGESQNFERARLFYEKAADKGLGVAIRSLGILHEDGHGVLKNLVTAVRCYQQSVEKGYAEGQKDLDRLMAMTDINATDEELIGLMYINGVEVTCDYKKGLLWLNKALAKNLASAYKHIGNLHACGHGVPQNLTTAAKHYYSAEKKGVDSSLELKGLELTAAQWLALGEDYYYGKNDAPLDRVFAFCCYKNTILNNANCPNAHYSLGWMLEHGQGGHAIDLVQAKKHYEQAAKAGDTNAINQLLIINHPTFKTAEEWYNLGEQYFEGTNSKTHDYIKAKICFELALKHNPKHAPSLYCLGLIFQYGHEIPVDLIKAKTYFDAASLENHELSQIQLRVIANCNLSTIKNQMRQRHVIRTESQLSLIKNHYPWVYNPTFAPRLTTNDMIDLSEEIDVSVDLFLKALNAYKAQINQAKLTPESVPGTPDSSELNTAGQTVFNDLQKYFLQISLRTSELLSASVFCDDEIKTISTCMSKFEEGLSELSSLTRRSTSQSTEKVRFFSSLSYFLTLSEPAEKLNVNESPKK